MTSAAEHGADWSDGDVPVEALARRQGVKPVTSLDALAHPELWDSDEDYEAFLADLHASRHGKIA